MTGRQHLFVAWHLFSEWLERHTAKFLMLGLAVFTVLLVKVHADENAATHLRTRVTKIEHVKTVELCSSTASCTRLLDQLFAAITPRQIDRLEKRLRHEATRRARAIAPRLAQQHRASERQAGHSGGHARGHSRAHNRARPRHSGSHRRSAADMPGATPAPASADTAPAAPAPIPVPVPAIEPAAPEVKHPDHKLHLCVSAAGIEVVCLHGESHAQTAP